MYSCFIFFIPCCTITIKFYQTVTCLAMENVTTKIFECFKHFVLFSAWLEAEDDAVVARVNQRIQDITGLTVDTAELLQVQLA